LGLAALFLLVCGELSWSQNEARRAATPERIADEVKKIDNAASWHATTDQLGILWGWLAADYQEMGDVQRAEEAYTHALGLLHGAVWRSDRMRRRSMGWVRCTWKRAGWRSQRTADGRR
jgi:hypothetical protein